MLSEFLYLVVVKTVALVAFSLLVKGISILKRRKQAKN